MLDAGFLHAEDSDRHVSLAIGAVAVLLFDRSSRAIKLTPAGKAFLAEARRLLQQSERAALSVHKIANGQTGVCRVGFTGGSVLSGLGAVVTTARTVIPDVELDLREMVSRAQVEALTDDGSLDIGLVRPPVTRPDLARAH